MQIRMGLNRKNVWRSQYIFFINVENHLRDYNKHLGQNTVLKRKRIFVRKYIIWKKHCNFNFLYVHIFN